MDVISLVLSNKYTDEHLQPISNSILSHTTQLTNHESRLNVLESGTGDIATNVNGLYRGQAWLMLQQEAKDRIDGGVTFADDMNVNRFGMIFNSLDSEKIIIRNGKMLLSNMESTNISVVSKVVSANANIISGNGGRKLVRLSNGWIVVACMSPQVGTGPISLYISKDKGNNFELLATQPRISLIDVALASEGMDIYLLTSANTEVVLFKIPITEDLVIPVEGISRIPNSITLMIDSNQTAIGKISLNIDPANGHLHAAWLSKNATYASSFNTRYSKSVDGGVTSSLVDQVTRINNGKNVSGVAISLKQGTPTILMSFEERVSSNTFNGSTWNSVNNGLVDIIYTGGTHIQSSPSAVDDKDGVIHMAWHGRDVTHPSIDYIRYSRLDSGATWSPMQKLQPGTDASASTNSLNHIFITYQNAGVTKFIKSIDDGDNWSTPIIIGTGTSPSTLDDNNLNFTIPLSVRMGVTNVLLNGNWSDMTEVPKTTATAVFDLPSTDFVGAYVKKIGTVTVEAYLNDELMNSDIENEEYEFVKKLSAKSPAKLRLELSRSDVTGGENDAVTRILGGRS